ncbi:transcription factor Pcc1-domain-containing protein [Bombardia bombarda]|uniref:Transcription factor Pcc1-domain-containing protein n=1 Tax=Bombardia bombarda TaxID=252184 RepID=A0AA39WN70_9PEZI|nr:transcription factor Pcc1-domain-containing protein [Bombardia bombarda]
MATDDNNNTAAEFPCSLTITIPFPDARLASIALRALSVDKELSALVHRSLTTTASDNHDTPFQNAGENTLRVHYKATTNRMLRVAVNSFMESVALVLEVMEELDVDVLEPDNKKSSS